MASDNTIIIRKARKDWRCWGDGASKANHAPGCSTQILKGQKYVEYVGETPAYQSGSRHSMACAAAFLTSTMVEGSGQ